MEPQWVRVLRPATLLAAGRPVRFACFVTVLLCATMAVAAGAAVHAHGPERAHIRDVALAPTAGLRTDRARAADALRLSRLRAVPREPRAARRFTISVAVSRRATHKPVRSGTVSCAATVTPQTARVTLHRFVDGRAVCEWQVPTESVGRALTGSIAVTARRHAARKQFAYRVGAPPRLARAYAGMDYVGAEHQGRRSPCDRHYTWLRARCWSSGSSSRLRKDIRFMRRQHLGRFQRVWVSLDELFACFDANRGFCGYSGTALANVDAALHQFAAAGMQVDLVLFANDNLNGFHFEALDGNHRPMRSNYLKALRRFLFYIAADPIAARAVGVIDLMNEAYYQSESHLADKVSSNGARCSAACLDANVILPWLTALYDVARAAAPGFLYTVSDTGRLLKDPIRWISRYPVDVYDIHVYDDAPWNNEATYARGINLPKPWFAGEAGCASGNVSCTYGAGAQTQQVDKWWLDNLRRNGAQAVLIEDKTTLFVRGNRYSLRPVGALVRRYNP
jgi:hypothetical protein